MSDTLSFRTPEGVSREQVQREADRLGYASVNQYLMDIFEHRDELTGGEGRIELLEKQLERNESRLNELEDRVRELESED